MLGFCTWEGGLRGIQVPNHNFARFEKALSEGKHVFLSTSSPTRKQYWRRCWKSHPQVELAGTGSSTQHWLVTLQQKTGMIRHS